MSAPCILKLFRGLTNISLNSLSAPVRVQEEEDLPVGHPFGGPVRVRKDETVHDVDGRGGQGDLHLDQGECGQLLGQKCKLVTYRQDCD